MVTRWWEKAIFCVAQSSLQASMYYSAPLDAIENRLQNRSANTARSWFFDQLHFLESLAGVHLVSELSRTVGISCYIQL